MFLIDSHCHIDGEAFDADRDDVIRRAREAGVAAMLCVGTGDPHSGEIAKAVYLAERSENVFASVGVHPHDARLYDDRAEQRLVELAGSEKVIGWGEIGLDHYYDNSPRDVQSSVFRRQIRKAKELDLPIIVHTRDADDETVEILTGEYGPHSGKPGGTSAPGVMHCFGGSPDTAEALLELGFFISFAGNVTFKKAHDLREAARTVPLNRLMVETDCPFLTPAPHRGKRNEPAYVLHTATFLSELYGIPLETLAEQTTQNFVKLFGLEGRINLPGQ